MQDRAEKSPRAYKEASKWHCTVQSLLQTSPVALFRFENWHLTRVFNRDRLTVVSRTVAKADRKKLHNFYAAQRGNNMGKLRLTKRGEFVFIYAPIAALVVACVAQAVALL